MMPAFRAENGENYCDEIDYRLWNPVLKRWIDVSLDEAVGKLGSSVTIFIK